MSTVFVSGANGYIAQHLVKDLIQKGYKVVGSVRSAEKGDALKKNIPELEYVVVKDITQEGAFDEALQKYPEIEGFFHTASPFFLADGNFEELIMKPAIDGTRNVLYSVKKHLPNLKRFIVTSSFAAMMSPLTDTPESVKTEETWSDLKREKEYTNPAIAYIASKLYAEKAVWEFFEKNDVSFTFNAINPAYVFGPQAFDSEVRGTLNTSAEIVNSVLKIKAGDDIPQQTGFAIDVRDVSKAHIHAYETKDTKQRYLLIESPFSSQSVLDIVNKNFPQIGLPKGDSSTIEAAYKSLPTVDNSKTKKALGKFVDLETSVKNTIEQIIRTRD